MKKRDVFNSPRLLELKRRRRKEKSGKILLYFFPFLIIFIGLIFISRIDRLKIKDVAISGNKIVETELISNVIETNLEGNYLYFFPKSNFLLFPKNKIESDLSSGFKRLKDIKINLENTGILSVSVSEREGKYIYCGETLPETEENIPCNFMDDSGYIFDLAPYFSGDVYFRFFGPAVNSFFSPELFSNLITLKENLSNMGLKPISLYEKPDKDIEIYLSGKKSFSNAPKIIFKNNFEVDKLSENLQAALTTEPLLSKIKNTYSSLLYLDLRFGNKVVYKFE